MKYIKGEQTGVMDEYPKTKMMLGDDSDPNGENIWVGHVTNSEECVLLNHAIGFRPFHSWGAILPYGSRLNIEEIRDKYELTLHPEAFVIYIENKIIDQEGNLIKQTK